MSDDKDNKGRSLYYQRFNPGQAPAGGPAYAAPAYATPPYGAAYGAAYGSAYGAADGSDEVGGGAFSVGRIIRICSTHWMTIFIFLILGLLTSFVIYQLLPQKYEAVAYYAMSVQGRSLVAGQVYSEMGGSSAASPLEEVFNTRREQFNTPGVQKRVIDLYRTEHSSSAVSTEELLRILREDTEMELVPRSRLVTVTVVAGDPELAADLANAYVSTCVTFMGDQNKSTSEQAVAWLTTMLDNEEHVLMQMEEELLNLRKSRKVESLNRERENIQNRLSALDARAIELETQISVAKELQAALAVIKDDPTKFGTLPESIPRSSEIVEAFQRWQTASMDKRTLLTRLTENHPDVKLKAREEEVYRDQFVETAQRAFETGKAQLGFLERQRQPVVEEASGLRARLIALDTDVLAADMALQQLERARAIEVEKAADLRERSRVARLKADENAATIEPYTSCVFSNVSMFGPVIDPANYTDEAGINGSNTDARFQAAMHLRRNTQLRVFNSVFAGFPLGLIIENDKNSNTQGFASDGKLVVSNCLFAGMVKNFQDAQYWENNTLYSPTDNGAFTGSYFNRADGKNLTYAAIADLKLQGNPQNLAGFCMIPSQESPLVSHAADWNNPLVASGFEQVSYIGAFSPSETETNNWMSGWTNMDPQNTVY